MKTSKKLIGLECIRGGAALLVFISHIFSLIPELAKRKNHLTNLFANWGTEAVILFFILSGIVIHSSFDRNPKTKKQFAADRAIRLYPLLILSVIASAVVYHFVFAKPINITKLSLNLIPMSYLSTNVTGSYYNPVVWSLSFEIFFYFLFTFTITSQKGHRLKYMYAWAFLSATSILAFHLWHIKNVMWQLISYFAFSSIWLLGYFAWKHKDKVNVNLHLVFYGLGLLPLVSRLHIFPSYYDPVKFFMFGICTLPLFVYLIQDKQNNLHKPLSFALSSSILIVIHVFSGAFMIIDTSYLFTIKILYISLPFVMLMFSAHLFKSTFQSLYHRTKYFFAYFGSISYSLYLFHYPIILLVVHYLNIHFAFKICIIIPLTVASCHLAEKFYQPMITSALKKILS